MGLYVVNVHPISLLFPSLVSWHSVPLFFCSFFLSLLFFCFSCIRWMASGMPSVSLNVPPYFSILLAFSNAKRQTPYDLYTVFENVCMVSESEQRRQYRC